ncbi:MAG: hypothetical protein ACOZNI_07445 [Myxococcota bacterium]
MTVFVALLAACSGGSTVYKGTGPMSDFFPYDGKREATYYYAGVSATSDDDSGDTGQTTGVGYNLVVRKVEPTETTDGVELVTFAYYSDDGDTETLLGSVKWASDGDGVRIYAFAEGTGDFTTFDTPVTFAADYMHTGEAVETVTNGYTFTSTYVEQADIHVQWGLDWEGTVHMNLDDGDGDTSTGPFFAGDYWLATRYGPGWMHLTGYDDKWDLADYEHCAEADPDYPDCD